MRRLLHYLFGVHDWRYRNPYDRTCEICHRWESEYFYPSDKGMERYGGMRGFNQWEVHYEGDEA